MQLSSLRSHAIPFGPAAAAPVQAAPASMAIPAATGAKPATPPMPTTRITVPSGIEDALTGAVERGTREATDWIAANPTGTIEQLQAFVMERIGTPPTGAAFAADHAAVREAVAARTPAQDETAVWIDEHGLFPPWKATIDSYVAKVGTGQARAGLALLKRANDVTGLLTFPIKEHYMRDRPFKAHADTPLVAGITHIRNGSFPSGHSSLAFAHSVVLGSLLPEQATDTRAIAGQLAYARTYAAAHYPSDIVAGAFVGAVAATFAAARPDAELPERPRR